MARKNSPHERDIVKVAEVTYRLGRKRDGTVTLTPGATTTIVTDRPLTRLTIPILFPTTPNAAAAIATTYLSARANGSFTLSHANSAQTDRTFLWAAVGD